MHDDYDRPDESATTAGSTRAKAEETKVPAGEAHDKLVSEALTNYKIAKPRRITIRGRVTHDRG